MKTTIMLEINIPVVVNIENGQRGNFNQEDIQPSIEFEYNNKDVLCVVKNVIDRDRIEIEAELLAEAYKLKRK